MWACLANAATLGNIPGYFTYLLSYCAASHSKAGQGTRVNGRNAEDLLTSGGLWLTLPAPSSGPFAHPKPSTNDIPTAIPLFGPGAPPSPPSTTSALDKSRRTSVDSHPSQPEPPHQTFHPLPTQCPRSLLPTTRAILPRSCGRQSYGAPKSLGSTVRIPIQIRQFFDKRAGRFFYKAA